MTRRKTDVFLALASIRLLVRRTTETIYPPEREGPIHHERKFRMGVIEDYEPNEEAHTMIYKRLNKQEMLKALEDHATFYTKDHSECLKWNEDIECYKYTSSTLSVYIDRFDDIKKAAGLIKMINTVRIMGHETESMIGAISVFDWMVEIPEEGEE